MKKLGFLKSFSLTKNAGKMMPEQRRAVTRRRLEELVGYAKQNSPYFADLYKNIGTGFSLEDLPPTRKNEMMGNFDNWLTDRTVTMESIEAFMDDSGNIGKKFLGKYALFNTSGSTGNPAIVLCDAMQMNVTLAIACLRSCARQEDRDAFVTRGPRMFGLFATDGFYYGSGSFMYIQRLLFFNRKIIKTFDIRNPQDEIINALNTHKPVILCSYPTTLELLIDKIKSGELRIKPSILQTSGECLSEDARGRLGEAFGGYVQQIYACTESGTIACECIEKHLHINDDWVIVEAVDENDMPVPNGTVSEKIFMTNLANYVHPFIRYEISDRVIMHDEPCPCGNTSPWLEIEGRNDDILTFRGNVRVSPISFILVFKEIYKIKRFQLIQHGEDELELRLAAEDVGAAFKDAKAALEGYLQTHGVHPSIYLSGTEPQADPISGKYKSVYKAAKSE